MVWLIGWLLTPTLAVFLLYRGVSKVQAFNFFYNRSLDNKISLCIKFSGYMHKQLDNFKGFNHICCTMLCSTCHKHLLILSTFMTYHRVCKYSNTKVPLVAQELLTPWEHISSLPGFSRVRVARFLGFCVVFVL